MPIRSWDVVRSSTEKFKSSPLPFQPAELVARTPTEFAVVSRFGKHRYVAEDEVKANWLSDFLNKHCGLHPLLGTTPDWKVEVYSATVELINFERKLRAGFAKPNHVQPEEWWRAQAEEAILNAKSF